MDVGGTQLKFEKVDAEKGFTAKPERTSGIKPRWNMGLAWTPAHFLFLPTGDRWLFTADVKDMFNAQSKVLFGDDFVPDTVGTHLHFGAEFRYWFLRFRGGFNQGYPSFGAGLDIPFLKLDYTYYSDELGLYSGTQEQSNHMITLALRFGTGNTEARDRVREIKNAKKAAKAKSKDTPEAEPQMEAPQPEAAPAAAPASDNAKDSENSPQ
jgi:hypothetical protein